MSTGCISTKDCLAKFFQINAIYFHIMCIMCRYAYIYIYTCKYIYIYDVIILYYHICNYNIYIYIYIYSVIFLDRTDTVCLVPLLCPAEPLTMLCQVTKGHPSRLVRRTRVRWH